MGLIRVILALAVVIAHSASPIFGYHLFKAELAVQSFYLISGFYIALVLSGKYPQTRQGVWLFYKNRFLRLAPSYWVVLLATLAAGALWGPLFFMKTDFSKLSPLTLFYTLATNILIFGQDIMMFLKVSTTPGGTFGIQSHMNYTGQVDATHIPAYCMLVVPQAWTLGVELSFYLFAPFLIRLKTRSLFGICLLSLALRIYLSRIGHGDDPFTYRFFPNELSTFVTGMLGCRFYLHYLKPKEGKKNLRYFGQAALVACLIDILTYNSNHMHETTKHVLSLILFAASIPFIFSLTKNNRFDRKIGDLSYPTYICHILVITLVSMIAIPRWLYNSGLVAPTISLAVAWLLVKLVEHPIDQMRWRNTAKVLRTIGKAP